MRTWFEVRNFAWHRSQFGAGVIFRTFFE